MSVEETKNRAEFFERYEERKKKKELEDAEFEIACKSPSPEYFLFEEEILNFENKNSDLDFVGYLSDIMKGKYNDETEEIEPRQKSYYLMIWLYRHAEKSIKIVEILRKGKK